MKIIFIVPSLNDSHYKNRIIEFLNNGYEVEVYGFDRENRKKPQGLPYEIHILGTLLDERYIKRILLYVKTFRQLGKKFEPSSDVFFLCGLDIALFFHYVNPKYKYIYEECDLTHTYTKLKLPLECIDIKIIKSSLLAITTSEGFIKYHFNSIKPRNVCLVENKLNPQIVNYQIKVKSTFDKERISIGFVGGPRFDSVYNFIDTFCSNFSNYTFHIFGGPVSEQFEKLKKYPNCIFHGFFKNPIDLPEIYSQLDLVLSTYDVKYENIRYAEPNKLYEAIYFETPIIVSSGTFLAEKVNRLGIGYEIDAMDADTICNFINNLTEESIKEKQSMAASIDKNELVNINDEFFSKLNNIIKSL